MALKRPRSSAAAIHRRIRAVAEAQGWRVPSYSAVYAIIAALDPRALAGYGVFLGAPCVLNTCLALRHTIWRKADPAWPVCGIPDVLYVDHGSDFTSHHLDQSGIKLALSHRLFRRWATSGSG